MKNELTALRQAEILKTEDLETKEKEITRLRDEVRFYQDTNKELINSIDEVERTLQEVEDSQILKFKSNSSPSDNSNSGQDQNKTNNLTEENYNLKQNIDMLTKDNQFLKTEFMRIEAEKDVLKESLATANSNIEILNETMEFMGDEHIQCKGELMKKREALNYRNREKISLETDLEDFKMKAKKQNKSKKYTKEINDLNCKVQELEAVIEGLNSKITQKELQYNELKLSIDKVKKLKDNYEVVIKKEKQILKDQHDKQVKVLQKEIIDLKSKLFSNKNDGNLATKVKKLNTSLLDRDIEIKTLKQDKDKYMSEIVDVKVKLKQVEAELGDKITVIQKQLETEKENTKEATEKMELKQKEGFEIIQNYKKFVRDISGVVKLLVKNSTKAIDKTKDDEMFNTEQNQCYKTMLEHKVMLLKVERKIIHKKSNGFKTKRSRLNEKNMAYEEGMTTTDEQGIGVKHKRVKIKE